VTYFFFFSSVSKYCSILTVYLKKTLWNCFCISELKFYLDYEELGMLNKLYFEIYVCVDRCASTWYSQVAS